MKTAGQINTLLGSYLAPGKTMVGVLNQVVPRLLAEGDWKDNEFEISADVSAGYYAAPPDIDSIQKARVNDIDVEIRTQKYEYNIRVGPLARPAGMVYGILDRGYRAVMSELPTAGLDELVFTLTSGTFATGDGITIIYNTVDDGIRTTTLSPASGTTTTLTPLSAISDITAIEYTSLPGRVVATAEDEDGNDIVYAILPPGEGTARFRWYDIPQVPEGTTDEWTLTALAKRAWVPLASNSDLVWLDNLGALKHGLLAVAQEDAHNMEEADNEWQRAIQCLEKELRTVRGGAEPVPQIDIHGRGIPALSGFY